MRYPESGTIPQLVVFQLLKKLYSNSLITVEGGGESVFGTNTTSKKPADLWCMIDNNIVNLFEITVKKIDYKRLDDCILSLSDLGYINIPIHFICRLPTDIQSLKELEHNTLVYKKKIFCFVDISNFILTISSLLLPLQLNEILTELRNFIARIDRRQSTKNGWNEIFANFSKVC